MNIESTDVIRLIQQFLKENNLHQTLEALQNETSVSLNSVDNVEELKNSIVKGQWDDVLEKVSSSGIAPSKLIDLYEQIVLELAESKETVLARALLRQTETMNILKDCNQKRFIRLEKVVSSSIIDSQSLYPKNQSKEKRRKEISEALEKDIVSASPSRLLTLLNQAVKWQQQQGIIAPGAPIDLFMGTSLAAKEEEDQIPIQLHTSIKFPKKQTAKTAVFSPDGQYFVTGSADGFVEVWNYMTGKLRKDLKYQAEDNLMMMESSVIALAFSSDSNKLASADQQGKIKIWRVGNGSCIKRIASAHSQGITSLCFSPDNAQVISTSFDGTIRIHGLKSGKMLKEYRGHTTYVNTAIFKPDMTQIISGSSDGSIKIWDYKTTNCLKTVHINDLKTKIASQDSINSIILHPTSKDSVIVCNRSQRFYVLTFDGKVVRDIGLSHDVEVTFINVVPSQNGKYIYALAENSVLYAFDFESGDLVTQFKVSESEVTGLVHHPSSNIIATTQNDRYVHIWRP
ncbi:hypothetical protein H4219_001064 [Mycoemilia scoparia]|uniref:CTLH domain-containing protein n=1 Tax=Mycoemilia scoparia TaxID=417184 RepID=A0A9W8A4C2_9FUNG|nr:hypothetical protein H4219_001064 [Mycoemilia scoparia]